ncbi:MAG: helix-turn-helix transcriptional regulator [Acidimicrobiia bacterium]|nr:helix-turn-helix transcriptional regulator [Acidimicrobiia bacterium]
MDPRGRDRAVYVISVAAELAGVHPQTLRVYERKGLVDPARTGGGSRRYSDADIELLQRIQELTNDGLNLAGVKKVLALEGRIASLEQQLVELRSSIADHDRHPVRVNQSIMVYDERDAGSRRRR